MKSLKIVMTKSQKFWRTDMSYDNKIRILENQLKQLESAENKDKEQIQKVLNELRQLRRAQYEESQRVNFDDDH